MQSNMMGAVSHALHVSLKSAHDFPCKGKLGSTPDMFGLGASCYAVHR